MSSEQETYQMTDQTPLQMCLSPKVLRQSLIVSLVVGTILTLINQGDALFSGGQVNMIKVGLTYLVPLLVSTYGAWNMARMSQMSGLGKATAQA